MNAQIKSSAQIQSSFEPETEENIAGHDFSIWNLKFFNKSWNIQLQLQDESFSCQRVFFILKTILSATYFILSIKFQLTALKRFNFYQLFAEIYFLGVLWNLLCLSLVLVSLFVKSADFILKRHRHFCFVLYHYPSIVIRCTTHVFICRAFNKASISAEAEQMSFFLYVFVAETFFLVSARVSLYLGSPIYAMGLVALIIATSSQNLLVQLLLVLSGYSFWTIFYYSRKADIYYFSSKELRKRLALESKIKAVELNEAQVAQELDETKAKALVFGQLAHDIGSPLAALSMAFELLENMLGSNSQVHPPDRLRTREQMEELREAFEAINAALAAMSVLRQSMLDYVKKATGVLMKPALEPVDIKQLVSKKAFRILQQLVRSKPSVKAAWSMDPSLQNVKILTSENWLLDMLLNFVSNAVKFTEKGQIEIVVSRNEANCEDLSLVIFEVKDSGCGIPESKKAELFEAFGQLQSNQGGTGLGLVAVKQKATLLGGTAGFYNNEGKPGATFYFSVPFALAYSAKIKPRLASFNSSLSSEVRYSPARSSSSGIGARSSNSDLLGGARLSTSGVMMAGSSSSGTNTKGQSPCSDANFSSFSSFGGLSSRSSLLRVNHKWLRLPQSPTAMTAIKTILSPSANTTGKTSTEKTTWQAKSTKKILPSLGQEMRCAMSYAQPIATQPTVDSSELGASGATKRVHTMLELFDSNSSQSKDKDVLHVGFERNGQKELASLQQSFRMFSQIEEERSMHYDKHARDECLQTFSEFGGRHDSQNAADSALRGSYSSCTTLLGTKSKSSSDLFRKKDFGRCKFPELRDKRQRNMASPLTSTSGEGDFVVMVVDDMPILLTLYNRLLKKAGVGSVLKATSGEACLQKMFGETQQQDVDIILMDDQMSGLRGPQVASKIVKSCEEQERAMPSIYLCSGSSPDVLNEEFPDLNQYIKKILQKPIGLSDIKRILQHEKNEVSFKNQSFRRQEKNTEIRKLLCSSGLEKTVSGKLFEINVESLLHNQLHAEYMRKDLDNDFQKDPLPPNTPVTSPPKKQPPHKKFNFPSVEELSNESPPQQNAL